MAKTVTNETDLEMTYPSLQRPDGSTVVLAPGESFPPKRSTKKPRQHNTLPKSAAHKPSVADGPADVTPPAEPAATSTSTPEA